MKKLIITADDYGMSEEVNKGIAFSCENEAISSVSVLANGKLDKLTHLMRYNVSFGVHLNLTHSYPINPLYPEELKENGKFPKYFRKDGIRQYNIEPETIWEEYKKQIEKVQSFVKVSYIDCHHHLQEVDIVEKVVIELSKKYDLAVRAVNNEMSEVFRSNNIRCTDGAILDFFEEGATADNFIKILSSNSFNISELVTHPGYVSEYIDDDYNQCRLNELTVLNDEEIKNWLRQRYEIISYNQLS